MKLQKWIAALLAVAGLAGAGAAQALTLTTNGDVLTVRGSADASDVERLQAALTPSIRTVVLRAPSGNGWQIAASLAKNIEQAKITTVVHGNCDSFACAMMFLAGERRMFSGAGRREMHYVALFFGDTTYRETSDQTPMINVVKWWEAHTALSGNDLTIHRDSLFSSNVDSMSDRLVFFPHNAKHSLGPVLHCSGERAKKLGRYQYLSDCMSGPGSTALDKKIVTTNDTFTHAALIERNDLTPPPATNIAAIDAQPIVPLNDECQARYKIFLQQDAPRAFVVGANQACWWSNAQVTRPYEAVITACRNAKIGECRFYAVDDKVAFVPFDQPAPAIGSAAPPVVAPVAAVKPASDAALPTPTPTLKPEHAKLSLARSYSKDEGLKGLTNQFTLEGKVVLFTNFTWEPTDWAPGPQHIEVKWFKDDKLTRTQRFSNIDYKKSPAFFWAEQTTAGLGEGQWHVDIHANGVLLGSKAFTISAN